MISKEISLGVETDHSCSVSAQCTPLDLTTHVGEYHVGVKNITDNNGLVVIELHKIKY